VVQGIITYPQIITTTTTITTTATPWSKSFTHNDDE
jgi:hypothetical protein